LWEKMQVHKKLNDDDGGGNDIGVFHHVAKRTSKGGCHAICNSRVMKGIHKRMVMLTTMGRVEGNKTEISLEKVGAKEARESEDRNSLKSEAEMV